MHQIDGQLVLSPTDLTKHLACAHITTLDLAVSRGELAKPDQQADEMLELIFDKGRDHESGYLQALRSDGRSIAEITTGFSGTDRRRGEQETVDAIRSGVDVVYQGAFFDGFWGGQADFLLRVERPSNLGSWSYEVADTKLARRLKVPALLQMAMYTDRLETLQGVAPEHLYVVTGDGAMHPWRLVDVGAFARRSRARLREAVVDRPLTEPVPVAHCSQCRWTTRCQGQWSSTDDLSLVASMRADHREQLRQLEIRTVAALADADPAILHGIGSGTRERLVGQARLQRCPDEDAPGVPLIQRTDSNQEVADQLADGTASLVGGSAWLWSREELAGAVDVLVVDEAGQFSLANAVAVSQASRSMVLLGDPQQLSQPSQATHPGGAGASVLGHLLDGHDTIPPDRGVFLPATWRMHPEIADFVSELSYDGRLEAGPGRDLQRIVDAGSGLEGSGLRYVPVAHTGCAAASDEEVAAVQSVLGALTGAQWIDHEGEPCPLRPEDVLVVAPYNNHVARLRAALPGVRVGTVDKFQGQQAPVVIYSTASSSAADAPRGVDFLYDIHRLNVAVSRAKCLAVVVGSPSLLDADVRTPEQLRKVNALCRFVEVARWVDVAG